jgi:hypothetical protein
MPRLCELYPGICLTTDEQARKILNWGVYMYIYIYTHMNLDSSVGIATRYILDGLVIESQWGVRFTAQAHTGPRALLHNGYQVYFPGE